MAQWRTTNARSSCACSRAPGCGSLRSCKLHRQQEHAISFTFTVVVCTRDRPEQLDRCLASLRALDVPAFELIVVDSAPCHFSARELARCWDARYLHEPLPGISRARNRGARASRGDIVAMLDDDAVAEPGWLDALADEFHDPRVAAVAGRTMAFAAHSDDERFFAAVGGSDCGDQRRIVDDTTPLWFERACFGGIGNGANLAFRRAVFDTWPGFCESLGAGTRIPGGEEHYAFFSLIRRGYRVVYAPQAVVRHPFPATLEALRRRVLTKRSSAVAYVGLLFAREPAFRLRIAKYLLEALRGVPRTWRGSAGLTDARIVSRPSQCAALVRGVAALLRELAGGSPGRAAPPRESAQVVRLADHVPVSQRRAAPLRNRNRVRVRDRG